MLLGHNIVFKILLIYWKKRKIWLGVIPPSFPNRHSNFILRLHMQSYSMESTESSQLWLTPFPHTLNTGRWLKNNSWKTSDAGVKRARTGTRIIGLVRIGVTATVLHCTLLFVCSPWLSSPSIETLVLTNIKTKPLEYSVVLPNFLHFVVYFSVKNSNHFKKL